jgi:hypothetical protein
VPETINRLARFDPGAQQVTAEVPAQRTGDEAGAYAVPPTRVDLPLEATEVRIGVFLDRRLPRLITAEQRRHFLTTVWRRAMAHTPGLARQLTGLTADPEQFDLQAVSLRQTYFPTAGPAAAEVWMRGVVAASNEPCYRELTWTGSVDLAAADRSYEVLVTVLVFGR